MRVKVTAIISFFGGIGWILFSIFTMATANLKGADVFLILFLLMTFAISTVFYVFWTDFGKKENSDLEKIEYENQLLKRRIEQKELKKKLDD